jgi:phage gp16-like protein
VDIAKNRIAQEKMGVLRTRPMDRPVYDPKSAGNRLTMAPWNLAGEEPKFLEEVKKYNKRMRNAD